MKLYLVYILKCSDNSYYTGVTSNLQQRLFEHSSGKFENSYTHLRRPVTLAYYCEFTQIKMAIKMEKQIKKWSREKKEALIRGSYDDLPNLAKKKFY